jgi:uncharacterized protein YndB with AHSA1/START domain
MVVELPSTPDMLLIEADFSGFTPDELFRYWTEADLITRWWPPEAAFDARQGGSYRLSWPSLNWCLYGTYLTFDPGKALVFTWSWEHEPEVAPIEVGLNFEAVEGVTKLRLSHGPHPDTEEGRAARQGHVEGWKTFLPKLGEIVFSL